MKILQIQSTYGKGSTGKIALDLNNCIIRNGWESYVAYREIRNDLIDKTKGYTIGCWVDHKLHALLCRINGRQAYFSTFPTLGLISYIKKIRPEIIHLHEIHSNYLNLILLLKYVAKTDIKLVVTLHDCWLFTGGCFHYTNAHCDKWQKECGNCPKKMMDTPAYLFDKSKQILRDRYKYFGKVKNLQVVGVSDWITQECQKSVFKGRNVSTIHNGVDLNVFKPTVSNMAEKLGVEDKFIILGPATKWLMPENKKALDYFANNMKRDEVLVLFGCGNEIPNMPKNIIQYGFTSNQKELAELYSMANVFVNLTHEDSLSFINLEAQACGTQVITYKNTGAQETVDGEYSMAVETDDFEGVLKAVRDIKGSQKSKCTQGCVVFMKEKFNKEMNYEQYMRIYQENINL